MSFSFSYWNITGSHSYYMLTLALLRLNCNFPVAHHTPLISI